MSAFPRKESNSCLGVKNTKITIFGCNRSAIFTIEINNELVTYPGKVKIAYLQDKDIRFIKEHNDKLQIAAHETFIDLFYPPRRTLIFFRSSLNFK